MIRNIFSRNGGEKPVNRLSQGLAAAFFTTTMLYGGLAQAQEAPTATVQTVAVTTNQITFHADADQKASEWVANQPDRVAVSIRYGGATTFAPEDIERIINHDLIENGITQAVFYWERGGATSGTSIGIETDDAVFGVFTLGEIRQKIPEVSRKINFNASIGLQQASLESSLN